jgi:hypothetical protein
MRSTLRALSLVGALLVLGAACGPDREPTTSDRAGPGEVTDAGAEGAFGDVDECSELAAEAVTSYERVVEELGDAERTDVERIDGAMESFGGLGPDLEVRLDALDCDEAAFEVEVCSALDGLRATGPAGRDLLERILAGCATS